jgi:hypothetical protein
LSQVETPIEKLPPGLVAVLKLELEHIK